MVDSFLNLVLGDLDEKKAYRQVMKRADALPEDYRFAFKKIQHYLYYFGEVGCSLDLYSDLIDLFEESAAQGKQVLDVVGEDVSAFSEQLVSALLTDADTGQTPQEKFNEEIRQHFHKEGDTNG